MVSLQFPLLGDSAVEWIRSMLPNLMLWVNSTDLEVLRTQKAITKYGLEFTLLTGSQANAIVGKRTTHLYACSSDPSGGAGGSGFYQWDGVAWSKFA